MNRSRRSRGRLATSIIIEAILLSNLCLTTLTISLLPRLSEEEFYKLPVFCKASTGYFECRNDTSGATYCLPRSLRCRVQCSNSAELGCPGAASDASAAPASVPPCSGPGQFACPGPVASCIAGHQVCDGRAHCSDASDEAPDMCGRRHCSAGQFACQSPGHCVPAAARCDGSFDCERTGLGDYSDELNCSRAAGAAATECGAGEFRCPLDPLTGQGGGCVQAAYVCDRFKDCPDGSDESSCPAESCNLAAGEFACDGRCLKASLRCDGTADCAGGADEAGCGAEQCHFRSEFFCRLSPKSSSARGGGGGSGCVSEIFVCDGHADCVHGEDEVCAADSVLCATERYWTCKSGQHCVPAEGRCDGLQHCPDGSDERGCPGRGGTAKLVAPQCPDPRAAHLCNGTRTCVSAAAACSGRSPVRCPGPDAALSATCARIAALSGGRDVCPSFACPDGQLCVPALSPDGQALVAECVCRPGYRPSQDGGCQDIDECSEELGACDQLCSNSPPGSFSCSCSPGYLMMPDAGGGQRRGVCRAVGASKLLVATETGIHAADSDTGAVVKVSSGLEPLTSPKFLAFDAARQRVFFHTRDGQVGHVPLRGGAPTVLARGTVMDSLAYDWTRGLLFYSVPETAGGGGSGGGSGSLWVMDATSGARSQLLRLSCPRGLALDPGAGRLFVSLWCGPRPGIYGLRLDGTELSPLVTGLGAPGHLALDQGRLFWLDTQLRGVFTCRLEGPGACSDLHAVWHMGAGYDGIPLGLDVFEDCLLWSDLRARGVFAIDKFSGAPMRLLFRAPGNQTTLSAVVYHSVRQAEGARTQACSCGPARVCVNATGRAACLAAAPDGGGGTADAATTAAAGPLPGAALGPGNQAALVPASVSAALLMCLICGSLLAAACLRRSGNRSLTLPGWRGLRVKAAGARTAMPKISSKTPLTECESGIGLEDQSTC